MSRQALWSLLLLIGLPIVIVARLYTTWPLAGTVTDAETGRPLVGVAVQVAGHHTVTDALGGFRTQGLHGPFTVSAEAAGYRPVRGLAIPIRAALLRQPLAVRLSPVELPGRVVDATTRAPIAGATILVGESEIQADAQGRYLARRVLPGSQIRARAPHYYDGEPLTYKGQAVQEIELRMLPATVAVRDLCTGLPIAGATVTAAGEELQSDAQGLVTFAHLEPGTEAQAACAGYDEARGEAGPGSSLVLDLRPRAVSGIVAGPDGRPLAGALVLARVPGHEPVLTYTDSAGAYRLDDVPAEATLLVRLAGYEREERAAGGEQCTGFQLEPFVAKGIYLAFHLLTLEYQAQLRTDLDLVDTSELNAVVIEIKTGGGYLAFQPSAPLPREIGAGDQFQVVDLRQLVADCKQRGIYTIARMPIFADNLLGTLRPQWAVHRPNGSVWRDALGAAWLDPFRQEVWDYNVGIAREAAELGFDEIQFDYVRFPSDGSVGECRYSRENTAESRIEAIGGFLAYARQELDKTGVYFSADLFGLTTFDPEEKGIGQLLERVAPHVDYVSPMLYPSTFLRGMLDLPDPWRSPYEVVKLSLDAAHQRTPALIRPWLQHFDDYHGLGITYGLREVRLQKQAAADGGAHGWLFWNIKGEYDPQAFDPE